MTVLTNLAAIHGFMRATGGELPEPAGVCVYPFSDTVHLQFDSLDDLRHWAAYHDAKIEPDDATEAHGQIHHRASTTWGPVSGKMIRFSMVYLEDVRELVGGAA